MGITKLYRIVENFSGSNTFIVKGFQSSKIKVRVTEGSVLLGIYGSPLMSGSIPASLSTRPNVIYNGQKITKNLNLSKGVHDIYIDTTDLSRVSIISVEDSTFEGELTFSTSYDRFDWSKLDETVMLGKEYKYIDIPAGSKQIDITLDCRGSEPTGYFRFAATTDNITWTNITVIDPEDSEESYVVTNWIKAKGGVTKAFINIEDFIGIRIQTDIEDNISTIVTHTISDYYKSRDLYFPKSSNPLNRNLQGYRYLIIDLGGVKAQGTSTRFRFFPRNENNESINYEIYNSNMEAIQSPMAIDNETNSICRVYGDVVEGKQIVQLEKPLYGLRMHWSSITSIDGFVETTDRVKIHLTNERPLPVERRITKDKTEYRIYDLPKLPYGFQKDVFLSDVLEYSDNLLRYYMDGYHGIRYDIPFTIDNVPALESGEKIKIAYLLPFNYYERRTGGETGTYGQGVRISVFTTKGRIFHNFPMRASGDIPWTDLFKFDESTIYNPYKKWLPVNDKSKIGAKTKYFPVLADYDYNQFDGRIKGTTGFVDHFNSGGLDNSTEDVLFDRLVENGVPLNTLTLGNIAKDGKLSVFANYNTSIGAEPIAIGTNDGGRTWHTKAYFAATDFYNNVKAGKIDFSPITSIAGAYVANSLRIGRKRFNTPNAETKTPLTPFLVNEYDKSLVTSMSVSDGTVQITTAENLNYDGNCPIIYFENVSANAEWNYICNEGFNAEGTINNGVFFRAEKVASNKYNLYGDLGNPYEGDMVCRHLHAINRVQSGYLISTGESYLENGTFQGGFLYLLKQTIRNGSDQISAKTKLEPIRLTSSPFGVNRASGAYLTNDLSNPNLLFVSDDTFAYDDKRSFTIEGRDINVRVTPIGIYKGKISDIDDLSKFECVCETSQTLISLIHHMGNFAADGHGGALCVSKGGDKWNIESEEQERRINGTDIHGNIYFGDKMIEFK